MKLAKTIFACAVIVAVMVAASAWALTRLPDAPIPAHWGLDGRPDGFASPALVLFMLPAIAAALSLVFAVLPAIMPPRGDLTRSRQPYVMTWLGAMTLLLVIHLAIISQALGLPLDMIRVCTFGTGLLLVLVGNYLPKTRFNYVIGIRTPWTLADERVWDRTHRFGGGLMLAAGAMVIAGGLLVANPVLLVAVILVPTLSATVMAVVYSALISPRVGAGPDA